jgi:cold shock protein
MGSVVSLLRKARLHTGIVAKFNDERGFGFIAPDGGGESIFVHISEAIASGLDNLEAGDRLSFEVEPGRDGKGPRATRLKRAWR